MAVLENGKYTPAEYLAAERKAALKSEYYRGEIFAMSGASRNHNIITGNLYGHLHAMLKNKGCRPYVNDMRLHIPINTLYTYPDIMVVCGEEEFLDNEFDTLINPVFIAEILSPSTADYDTGGKFTMYRSVAALKEYWVLSSYEYRLAKFLKNEKDNTWILSETTKPTDSVLLTNLNLTISVEELYRDVQF